MALGLFIMNPNVLQEQTNDRNRNRFSIEILGLFTEDTRSQIQWKSDDTRIEIEIHSARETEKRKRHRFSAYLFILIKTSQEVTFHILFRACNKDDYVIVISIWFMQKYVDVRYFECCVPFGICNFRRFVVSTIKNKRRYIHTENHWQPKIQN